MDAKARGVRLSIEVVLPHLLLEKTFAERTGLAGMQYVMSPPLRHKRNQPALWNALASGLIDAVGTAHCPFDNEQKLLGKNAFTQIPNGIPGIEERVSLMYTYGVNRGRLDLHRFVDALSTRPAKLFGLFPRKGTIAVGSDADLIIFDPTYRGVISARSQHINSDYSGFEGFAVEGRPAVVTVRGKIQVRDGSFVGERVEANFCVESPLLTVGTTSMPADGIETIALLKELRELTANADGAQRVAWTDTWLKARRWFESKLEGLPLEHHYDAAGNHWVTLEGRSKKCLISAAIWTRFPMVAGSMALWGSWPVLRSCGASSRKVKAALQ